MEERVSYRFLHILTYIGWMTLKFFLALCHISMRGFFYYTVIFAKGLEKICAHHIIHCISILLHSGLKPAWHFWLSTRFSFCLKMKSVENILGYIWEQFYRLLSKLISSSDNKKILLTTRNVTLDSGRYATKYYYFVDFTTS